MMHLILECLSETWLIIAFVMLFVALAKYDQKRQMKIWSKNLLSIENGGHGK